MILPLRVEDAKLARSRAGSLDSRIHFRQLTAFFWAGWVTAGHTQAWHLSELVCVGLVSIVHRATGEGGCRAKPLLKIKLHKQRSNSTHSALAGGCILPHGHSSGSVCPFHAVMPCWASQPSSALGPVPKVTVEGMLTSSSGQMLYK